MQKLCIEKLIQLLKFTVVFIMIKIFDISFDLR